MCVSTTRWTTPPESKAEAKRSRLGGWGARKLASAECMDLFTAVELWCVQGHLFRSCFFFFFFSTHQKVRFVTIRLCTRRCTASLETRGCQGSAHIRSRGWNRSATNGLQLLLWMKSTHFAATTERPARVQPRRPDRRRMTHLMAHLRVREDSTHTTVSHAPLPDEGISSRLGLSPLHSLQRRNWVAY